MSNDNSSISYIKILDTDTRSIEMHRIKCDLVESRNKSKLFLFWYILNLYGKLPLLVKKFLQKDQFKGPKKEKKNVDFATFLKSPHFLQMNR